MRLVAPCLDGTDRTEEVTEDLLWVVLRILPELEEDRFAILDSGSEFIQTSYEDSGYLMEWQDGSTDRQYRWVRDLPVQEVTSAFTKFLNHDSTWRDKLGEFVKLDPRTWEPESQSKPTGFVVCQLSIPRLVFVLCGCMYLMGYLYLRAKHTLVHYEHFGGREHVIVPSFYHSWHSEQVMTLPWSSISMRELETYTADLRDVRRMKWLAWIYSPLRWGESRCWQSRDDQLERLETDDN